MSTHLAEARHFKKPVISPLRYPGGKAALYQRLRSLLRANGLSGGTYVEPYAGGAGAALALLVTGQVNSIVVNDLDPAVYAFWMAVVTDPAAFVERVRQVELTVVEWEKQRTAYLNADRRDYQQLGFATFYLNRTNRSGVLNGGPIGGKDQSGNYKIDARFNRAGLAERIRLIGLHASRITVHNSDGLDIIRKYSCRADAFIYADPPYFEKAGSLYLNSFTADDHASLAQCLNTRSDSRWILTYDNVPQVPKLYPARRREVFSLNYSAHRVEKATEVMVFSDRLSVP